MHVCMHVCGCGGTIKGQELRLLRSELELGGMIFDDIRIRPRFRPRSACRKEIWVGLGLPARYSSSGIDDVLLPGRVQRFQSRAYGAASAGVARPNDRGQGSELDVPTLGKVPCYNRHEQVSHHQVTSN